MSLLDDVKEAAEEYMTKHTRFWTLTQALDETELAKFMEWFSSNPRYITIRKFFRAA